MKLNRKGMVLASSAVLLTTVMHPALAQSTAELLQTAEAACIENAAQDGYDPNRAEVISSRAIDSDKVEVVLNLTKDGQNFDRLTCPYSVSSGIGDFVSGAADAVAAPNPGLGRLWWLLLPIIGLPLLFWALRGRDRSYTTSTVTSASDRVYTEGYVNTDGGLLEVREQPDSNARVIRSINNGEHVRLTGRRSNDWVELTTGGWVPNYYLRYTDNFSRR
jgi:hypothetical protein